MLTGLSVKIFQNSGYDAELKEKNIAQCGTHCVHLVQDAQIPVCQKISQPFGHDAKLQKKTAQMLHKIYSILSPRR